MIIFIIQFYTPMSKNTYPSLFKTTPQKKLKQQTPYTIPSASIHDQIKKEEPKIKESNYAVIFGYTNETFSKIQQEVHKISARASYIEFGKNYSYVRFEKENEYDEILKLNRMIFDGEMVGVFMVMDMKVKKEIVRKKVGYFKRIVRYFLGDK